MILVVIVKVPEERCRIIPFEDKNLLDDRINRLISNYWD